MVNFDFEIYEKNFANFRHSKNDPLAQKIKHNKQAHNASSFPPPPTHPLPHKEQPQEAATACQVPLAEVHLAPVREALTERESGDREGENRKSARRLPSG